MTTSPFHQPITEQDRVAFAEAEKTLYLLADQVGVRCGQCGAMIHGHDAIGAVSHMAPMRTKDYKTMPYCVPCADQMREDSGP